MGIERAESRSLKDEEGLRMKWIEFKNWSCCVYL